MLRKAINNLHLAFINDGQKLKAFEVLFQRQLSKIENCTLLNDNCFWQSQKRAGVAQLFRVRNARGISQENLSDYELSS